LSFTAEGTQYHDVYEISTSLRDWRNSSESKHVIPHERQESTNCVWTEMKVFMNDRDSNRVNVPEMLLPTDVAPSCCGLFPAVFVTPLI
jgi:hypothetical protein